MAVDEFVFRVEAMARATNTTKAVLASSIHFLLDGKALNWYWIYIRNSPRQTWKDLSEALVDHFAVEESDQIFEKRLKIDDSCIKSPLVIFVWMFRL